MRIQIKTEPLGRLAVLRNLPDAHLAVLEGLNGIGKTLAIRLLQICTGTIPYRLESPAWKSLCQGLGEFRVTITDLNGAEKLEWVADSRDWLELADGQSPVPFRSVTLNEEPVTDFAVIHRQLAVYRLAGDEGIIETLAQQADSEASFVRRWARRYAGQTNSPLASLEDRLSAAADSVTDWSIERYREIRNDLQRSQEASTQASTLAEQAIKRRGSLMEAADLRRQLQLIEQRTPDLEEQLVALDTEILTIQDQRDATQHELMTLAGQVAGAEALVHELRNARRTRDRHRGLLAEALDAAGKLASDLGIEPTIDAVETTIAELEARFVELTAQQLDMDAAPTMRRLLDQLTSELAEAESRGLANQPAIDDSETDTQLTVAQTKAGMLTRRVQLEGQPPPPEAKELIEQLADVGRRIELAHKATAAFVEANRRQRLAADNERRVDEALAAMDPHAVERLQQLEHERRRNDDQIVQLATKRAALRQQLGNLTSGESVASVSDRFAKTLKRTGVQAEQLDDILQRAGNDVSRLSAVAADSSARVLSVKRDLAHANAEIQRASQALISDDSLDWLRRGLELTGTQTKISPESMLDLLNVARTRIRRAMARLAQHRSQLAAVENGLIGTGEHLRGREPKTQEYLDELESWLGNRFSGWFNIPRVRSELLPDAEGDVIVNLQRREVVWSEGGVEVFRPLEAFSSGDAAFAYTRARLGVLDDEETQALNRFIALDEFGAFMARDRLSGLMAYLQDRADEYPNDQVLVILPLTRDYAEQAATAVGSEADRLNQLAEEIDRDGYATQELVS
jgi:hypothetical protein